ncbi:type IV secretion system DNA-binding domain-containing protein [Flexibacterium corallicola]|uniref:type IV secretion system DNA-binding domain-containing protein n=1 Tax=Flexibacterium corallicola TaxID=3037259 RepID=UPI00286FA372|nr:type IV secretion system DNA-binding domain-containing protein [Pseudovibrio sp. M1P-2-3]
MFSPIAPQAQRPPRVRLLLNTALAFLLSVLLAGWLLFLTYPPMGWYQDHPFPADLPWLAEALISNIQFHVKDGPLQFLLSSRADSYRTLLAPLYRYELIQGVSWRLFTLLAAALAAVLIARRYASRHYELVNDLRHIRGRQHLTGKIANSSFRQHMRKDIKRTGKGLCIAPKAILSADVESKHMLLIGASGAGKTQIMRFWVDQLLVQNTRMILHDPKGDMTAFLPTERFILLAPHDKRSWAWDIAKDCVGLAAARELAARLIPQAKDPLWTNGAREILTGLLRWLQTKHETVWSWTELRDIAFNNPPELKTMVLEVYPEGANFIEVDPETGTPNKTSYSFLVTLWSYVGSIISPLALAWEKTPDEKRVSLTQWIATEETERPVIILQKSAEFDVLSKAWIGAAVQLLANFAASPALEDSRERKVWLLLDEFAQMGKLSGFQQFLEVGRSRGIRTVLGLQDLEQLAHLYGREALKTWLNTIETKIVCRMNAGPSSSFISKDLIGQREVAWEEVSTSVTHNDWFSDQREKKNTSRHIRSATIPVLMPDYFERDLGPMEVQGEPRIRALVLGRGDVYQFDWPLTLWRQQRPGAIPAPWLTE